MSQSAAKNQAAVNPENTILIGLLNQLGGPLSTQLADRRSTIVKQACHLLCLLSKELLGDFEACAEMFIPVLFKLVVITVPVIAESADNCIKTMLRNCKAARVLPSIAESAKHDRNAILRARCCEYALLTLENWPEAPEIQRSVDLYEDMIRCCVADAMSEVRATARTCYRMFAKTWPDRSRRLFSFFDPVIQRLIIEEEGGIRRRHTSPSARERHSLPSFSQASTPSNLPGYVDVVHQKVGLPRKKKPRRRDQKDNRKRKSGEVAQDAIEVAPDAIEVAQDAIEVAPPPREVSPPPRPPPDSDSEVTDDFEDFELTNPRGQIKLPRRSPIIDDILSDASKRELKTTRSTIIGRLVAEQCLGSDRFGLLMNTFPTDEEFILSDHHGNLQLIWATEGPNSELTNNMVFGVSGNIRNQYQHELCWDFSLCDLISITAVLYGRMKKYKRLSHMYICQEVDKKSYSIKWLNEKDIHHRCYRSSIYESLEYLTRSTDGIPIALDWENQVDFNCTRRRQLRSYEETFKMTKTFKYPTLKEALWRLETHPVIASLTCFENWTEAGIYEGPKNNSVYEDEHAVLMLDYIEFQGQKVIRCKSSNGKVVGNNGYLYVSPREMIIAVGGARKQNGAFTCLNDPRHLLYDFYSVEMSPGPYPVLITEDPARKKKNNEYRVPFGKNNDAKSGFLRSGMSNLGSGMEEADDPAPQKSADNVSPDFVSPSKDDLLEEACKKYDEAIRLCPTLYDAYYSRAIAISDRAKMHGRSKEAGELWGQATNYYEKAVQLNGNSSQALNNWGLALQELSQIVPAREKEKVVRTAVSKFREAIRLQFDFHGAIYNLGTVLYGLAEDTLRTEGSGPSGNGKDLPPDELYSQSAIYIAIAHSLKPSYSVYSSTLRLVRSMLPIPHLKVGYLTAPPVGNSLAPHSDWKRTEFELNHERLLQVLKPEAMNTNVKKKRVQVNITEIVSVTPCADPCLPPGAGLCIDTIHGPVFLVADSWESLDGWLDAIRLVYTVHASGKSDVLAGIITA